MSDKLPPTEYWTCGTYSGYVRHYKRGEYLCDPCRLAGSEYSRAYQQANREKVAAYSRKWSQENRERNAFLRDLDRTDIACRAKARQSLIREEFAPIALHLGQRWTAEDDAIIRATYDQVSVMVAAQLRRTPGAIRDRRFRLRKLDRNQRKATA